MQWLRDSDYCMLCAPAAQWSSPQKPSNALPAAMCAERNSTAALHRGKTNTTNTLTLKDFSSSLLVCDGSNYMNTLYLTQKFRKVGRFQLFRSTGRYSEEEKKLKLFWSRRDQPCACNEKIPKTTTWHEGSDGCKVYIFPVLTPEISDLEGGEFPPDFVFRELFRWF